MVNTEKVDLSSVLDGIVNNARSSFKNKDKGLGLQIISGTDINKSNKASDFVFWKDSPWELCTSIMGAPFGKVVQISGRPDSGKSTHAMQFMALAQAQGHIVLLWDAEQKFSTKRFDNYFGGKSKDLLVVSSKMISEGADMVEALVHSVMEKLPDKKIFIVWDSVGGSLPKSEKGKSKRDSHQMAEAAKENGAVVRGLVMLMEEYRDREKNEDRIGVMLINQTYANIGAPGQIESGGQKVAYHSSLIVQLTRVSDLFKVRDKIKRKAGIRTKMRVKKNHLFDGEDTIAEMLLDITAGGIAVAASDPAHKLVAASLRSTDEFEEDTSSNEDGWESDD
jgi:RecA/RadA recombinase